MDVPLRAIDVCGYDIRSSLNLYIGHREMVNDRRKSPRVRVSLPARWEGAMHQGVATVTDVSEIGCFVLSGGAVELKELIWLEIQLPSGDLIRLWTEVVDAAYEIGFALKFNSGSGTGDDEARLRRYIETVFGYDSRKT